MMLPARFDPEYLKLSRRARSVPSPGRVHDEATPESYPVSLVPAGRRGWRRPALIFLTVLGLLLTAASARADIRVFPSSERRAVVREDGRAVLHGPGLLAKRRVVTFTVGIDGHEVRLGYPAGKSQLCWGAADTGDVFVLVNACGRVARVTVESFSGRHRVFVMWEWRP